MQAHVPMIFEIIHILFRYTDNSWELCKRKKSIVCDTKNSIFVKCRNMGRKEKLLKRFLQIPKDFTFEETVSLLGHFGYFVHNKGKTSGSRIRFKNDILGTYIDLHRPHPGSIMKLWMLRALYDHLRNNNLI